MTIPYRVVSGGDPSPEVAKRLYGAGMPTKPTPKAPQRPDPETAEWALDLLAQGYTAEKAARVTSTDLAWVSKQRRPATTLAEQAATPR